MFGDGKVASLPPPDPKHVLLLLCVCVTAWQRAAPAAQDCPSRRWNAMCRPCCEYHLIECRCPSRGSRVGYTVPCCRNALDECDPCIIHPGCSLFENCKTCHNGTWRANDDFFVNGKYCTECRQGWSGGDCRTCGAVIQRAQGHIALESYPTNARCEWRVQAERGGGVEMRFSRLSLESDHSCRYDYVEVRDGDDLNSPVIGRYCGDRLPEPIASSGGSLHVLFVSDGYHNFDGFVLTFQQSSAPAVRNPACALPPTPMNGYLLPAFGLEETPVSVSYRCRPPFTLLGAPRRNCLPDGTWSGTAPTCVKGQASSPRCSPPAKLPNGYYRDAPDAGAGAQAVEYFCKGSFILSGSHRSSCLSNGSWSDQPPKCVRACREPKVSELVRQTVVKPHPTSRGGPERRLHLSSRYDVADVLSAGFIPLTLDGGVDAAGLELPRGFHAVHTSIRYQCASPLYQHAGSSRRTCLKTGRWSGRHVSCSPVCGEFDALGAHNLSDTRLPWHAAIYIRSPPDPTAGSRGPPVMPVSDQRGASEESSFWYLACSGALLSQRSVLVAARCVVEGGRPVHPAHVKVVVGARQPAPGERAKKPPHLRVSDVLVHPHFSSKAPDADVAVLKLRDKARISRGVLPACLPETQGGEVTAQEAYVSRWTPSRPGGRDPLSRMEPAELADISRCEREFAKGGAQVSQLSDNNLCVVTAPDGPQSPCTTTAAAPHLPGISSIPPASSALPRQEETGRASGAGWQLLGLETFVHGEGDCRRHVYALHTKVANFQKWIKENMK